MALTKRQLVNEYVEAIYNGDAAFFIGAGLSRASGFVDWKGLLRGCAEEIGLDLEREYDLVAVAQYYLNLSPSNRQRLNGVLLNEFGQEGLVSENHNIIARLPVPTIWTTNFDTLIEQAFHEAKRRIDVKKRDIDISQPRHRRDAILYKMHGDIAQTSEVVICKADYERYARKHSLFQTTLEADLASKTFLFLGFSFADPNLNYMLGHLHAMLEENAKGHFAVMRRARENQHIASSVERRRAYDYERNKQDLQVRELERYNIRTLLIENFADVTSVLRSIEVAAFQKNVFVSGSASKYADDFQELRVRDLCMHLGELLMSHEFKLVTGFGLNVGQPVFQGALLKLYERKHIGVEDHFVLRPFPRNLPSKAEEAVFNDRYRRSMVSQCGFAVFICGTSRSQDISAGVVNEYEIARELGKVPIPIGATGYAARHIWNLVAQEREAVYRGAVSQELFGRLNDPSLNNEDILAAVFEIIRSVSAATADSLVSAERH